MHLIAIISDVHANLEALDAVLRDVADLGVKSIVCLGDVVGYGAAPAECVERVSEACAVTVMGNHELMLREWKLIKSEFDRMDPVGQGIAWAHRELSSVQAKWLRELPLTARFGGVELAHSSLAEPGEFDYLTFDEDARRNFAAQSGFISFHGHTHIPRIWEWTNFGEIRFYIPADAALTRLDSRFRYAINVGSVGQPRDNDPRASYVIYNPDQASVLFRRVAYDIPAAQRRMELAGLPTRGRERIARGA